MSFSEQFKADADRLVRRYPVARSALLPLLHLVQSEHNYVTDEGIAFCAERLALTKAEVGAVATFYTMYKREPVGDYLLSVCTQPTCAVAGAARIFDRYKTALGGKLSDPDTKVTIEEAECLGICDAAPVVQVNYEMYGNLKDAEADALFAGCRKGAPPVSPWSGEPAPTFADVERELSGANDGFGDALISAARHSIDGYDVKPAYKTGMTDLPVNLPGADPAGHGGEMFAADFAGTPRPDPMGDVTGDADRSALAVGDDANPGAQHEPFTSGATVDMDTPDEVRSSMDVSGDPEAPADGSDDAAGYPGDSGEGARSTADVPSDEPDTSTRTEG